MRMNGWNGTGESQCGNPIGSEQVIEKKNVFLLEFDLHKMHETVTSTMKKKQDWDSFLDFKFPTF